MLFIICEFVIIRVEERESWGLYRDYLKMDMK